MNENIKRIAEAAGQGNPYHIPPEFINKFAELLVKESGEVAAFGDSRYTAQHNIHEYFGVK